MMTTTSLTREWARPKETWTGNVLAEQQRAHNVEPGERQLPRPALLSDSTQASILQLPGVVGGGLCFAWGGGGGFGIFRIISEVPSEPPEPLQSQARAAHV